MKSFERRTKSASIGAFFLASLLFMQNMIAGSFVYPDFDQSMLRDIKCLSKKPEDLAKCKRQYLALDQKLVKMFRDIYNRNVVAANQSNLNIKTRIPRIVHQIWLGGPVPERYREWMSSWMLDNGWEYMLWTDENVKTIKLHNQELYDKSINYGEKADILRLEVLEKYGGVYADIDYECFNSDVLEELHRSFDFYIGFEPIEHGFIYKFFLFKVCNALIGAKPGHPLLKDLIVNMKANFLAYRDCTPVERTGPSYITRIICEYEKSHAHKQRNMYLPCTFFYPYTEAELNYFIANPRIQVELCPETLGIHYWSGSWRKTDPSVYMQLDNDN